MLCITGSRIKMGGDSRICCTKSQQYQRVQERRASHPVVRSLAFFVFFTLHPVKHLLDLEAAI